MKKRLSAIFMITVLLFTMVGCHSSQEPNNESTPTSATTPTETPSEETHQYIHVDRIYQTFEESLSAATNIVIATYTGEVKERGIWYDFVFSPVRQLKGSDITEEFHLRTYKLTANTHVSGAHAEHANGYTMEIKETIVEL